ncbi:hypothetical protein Scep_024553 [Stephania cephalantha]|uniref:Uncharacterized protein n=1 Tax=Stephania cephalantha TaxID=152367 RepID=A0AAP0F400_9MAGN
MMKGMKEEEKMVSPMFPRLHVNDTEKGGPRAPPRNKMALYEQLSIPTQRFNPGLASNYPPPPTNTGTSVAPSPGGRHERVLLSSFGMPSTTTASRGTSVGMERLPSTTESGSSYPHRLPSLRNAHVTKPGNDDDFRVPTFVDSNFSSYSNRDEQCLDSERLTRFSPNHPGHFTVNGGNDLPKAAEASHSSLQMQNAHDKHRLVTKTKDLRTSQENLKESVTSKNVSGNIVSSSSTREKITGHLEHAYASLTRENRSPGDSLRAANDCHSQLNHDRDQFLPETGDHSDGITAVVIEDVQKAHLLRLKSDSCSGAVIGDGHRSPNEFLGGSHEGLFPVHDVDRNDDVSETSMVDSLSGLDISPDDVVGVMGKSHFWKARRAIVNQQRLFAVQVFELHRLIKVQRLIAGSPHLLVENGAYITKCSLKVSPARKVPTEYVVKPSQHLLKPRVMQKLNDNTELGAENIVEKSKLSSGSDTLNRGVVGQLPYGQYPGNAQPAPVVADDKSGWYFHPPPGNQWLVPVMSPSEGLVYKPWTGPCPPPTGFMAPVYGGCVPMNSPPVYGIPTSHPQGFGPFPGVPPYAQTYLPPYNMPVTNPAVSTAAVEQVSPLAAARPFKQVDQVSTGEVNFNMHSRNSCKASNPMKEAISCFQKFQTSKESEIQGSTASSPSERVQRTVAANVSEGSRDGLSIFPVSPAVQDLNAESIDKQHARVIRVVPHNPRRAPESAARIFQSIQEERKQ